MNLTLRQLRAFLAVARSNSFTQASRELHLSPSALSLLVKELEGELGFRLLDRTTRKVALSQAGQDFYPLAERVIGDLQFAVRNATELNDLKRGTLRVCAPQILACTFVVPALADYKAKHPEIRLRPIDTLIDAMLDPVTTGQADFAIGPDTESDSRVEREALFDSPYVLWCPDKHPLAKMARVSWRDLKKHPITIMGRDFLTRVLPKLNQFSEELSGEPFHEVAYVTTGLSMAAVGMGITVAPAYIAPVARQFGLKMIMLHDPKIVRTVSIYKHRDRSLSPAAASFIEFLHSRASGMRAGQTGHRSEKL